LDQRLIEGGPHGEMHAFRRVGIDFCDQITVYRFRHEWHRRREQLGYHHQAFVQRLIGGEFAGISAGFPEAAARTA
jgi:hypothetical protein